MKTIEVYSEVTGPPLYDYFLDEYGVFLAMDEIGEVEGVIQIVFEGEAINDDQRYAVFQMAARWKAMILFITEIPSYL